MDSKWVYSLLFFMCISSLSQVEGKTKKKVPRDSAEGRLYRYLMGNYSQVSGKNDLPLPHSEDRVPVSIGFAAVILMDVDVKAQAIRLNGWMRYTWKDYLLRWQPEEFKGVDHINVEPELIWQPGVTLLNSAQPLSMLPEFDQTMTSLSYDGSVLYIPNIVLDVTCTLDLTSYPLDKHECNITFYSPVLGTSLNLKFFDNRAQLDTNDFIQNSQWSFMPKRCSIETKKQTKFCKGNCDADVQLVHFGFKLTRRLTAMDSMYLGFGVILAFMAPLVFLLPHGSGDRTTLAVGIEIIVLIILMSKDDFVVAGSLLAHYYVFSFVSVGVALILSTIFAAVFRGCMRAPPGALSKVCYYCAFACCAPPPRLLEDDDTDDDEKANQREWSIIADIIDRIMFLLHVIVVTIMTGVYLEQIFR